MLAITEQQGLWNRDNVCSTDKKHFKATHRYKHPGNIYINKETSRKKSKFPNLPIHKEPDFLKCYLQLPWSSAGVKNANYFRNTGPYYITLIRIW